MSEDDNRSPANLMPLCFEHAWEIDQAEDTYPADLLREWKAAQLEECRQLQKSWSLTDAEVSEVSRVSFDSLEHSYTSAAANIVMQTITEVGVLIEQSRTARRGPAAIAQEWRDRQVRANSSTFIYNAETGHRAEIQLSRTEVRGLTERLQDSLARAVVSLEPQCGKVKGLLLAVSVDTQLEPWCEWVESAVDQLLSSSSRWPAAGAEDDSQVLDSIDSLRRASVALGQKARGLEPAPPPKPRAAVEAATSESESDRRFREHNELLEKARPWARVDHLPFDAALYDELILDLEFAVALPSVPSLLASDFDATARLAARVAKNAEAHQIDELLKAARRLTPVAAAGSLLWNIHRVAEKFEQADVSASALDLLTDVLREEDWISTGKWADNGCQVRTVLNLSDHLLGTEHVHQVLRNALARDPSIAPAIVVGIAQWAESRDFDTFEVVGVTCRIENLPVWLPSDELREALLAWNPELRPSDDIESDEPDPNRLGAQFLYCLEKE